MMVWKILIAIELLTWASPSFAVGTFIAVTVLALEAGSFVAVATAFAINLVVSTIISRALAPDPPTTNSDTAPNPGQRAQVAPTGSNKLPIIYGSAYTGGTIVDLSITSNNQNLYYVLALSEVTNSEYGNTGDVFQFGDIYFGGKKCIFDVADKTRVTALLDPSTGTTDNSVNGLLYFYLYRNGSYTPVNSGQSAISVMQSAGLVYTWDNTKLMTNTCFAILKIIYNYDARLTGLQSTKFQVINPRSAPGDCFYDYMRSSRYGGALTNDQIDQTSLTALNAYCNGTFNYTTYTGAPASQTRFRFDGLLQTEQAILTNMQYMATSCDCLIRYNEIQGKWGVVVQSPATVPVMDLTDTNIISALQVTPIDIASSYNIAEVKFADKNIQDSFASAIFDLRQINPALLYPNEPINKQQITLLLVNDDVRAQYIANRFLEGAREDLQVSCSVNFSGLQLEAGDIVTVTNANYGWSQKQFRLVKVTEKFDQQGNITAELLMTEYNAAVYDDVSITQFTPAPNTGITDGSFFGTIPAPVISNISQTGSNPGFDVTITTSSSGIIQYAELYYSDNSNPTIQQLTFAGQTTPNPAGNPLGNNVVLPPLRLGSALPAGVYYFFSRMRNSLSASAFSPASTMLYWQPAYIADVENFQSSGTYLFWNPVINPQLQGYTIKFHYGANADWNSAIPLFSGLITSTNYNAISLPNQLVTVMIKAVDNFGNQSQNAAVLETVPFSGGSIDGDNIVFTYDFKANLWPGTITGGTVVGSPPNNNIVATDNSSFYGADNQSFYGLDTDSFYEQYISPQIQYTSDPVYISQAYAGSNATILYQATGTDVLVEYRAIGDTSFYGIDGDSKYGPDADSFYGQLGAWTPLAGVFNPREDYYEFRITVLPNAASVISQMALVVDARVIVEYIPNWVVNGGAIAYTKPFIYIKTVQATLQTNALNVVTLETNKTVNLQPTITGYNSAHTQVNGALADIILEGY